MNRTTPREAPTSLTRSECERVWRYDRAFLRAGAMAVLVLAVGLGVAQFFGDAVPVRIAVILLAATLIVGGLLLQFAARCPRCGTRVGALAPPSACHSCGVAFPRPEHIDSELDN